MKPTVVLVHGAFAESSSWNAVVAQLAGAGHRLIAFAVPLRGIAGDAAALDDLLRTVAGPVVLVGHSYGGAVITNSTAADVVALVYVAGFALAPGESCADASALAPGSTLGETLELVALAAGGADAYIAQDRYHQQFAADLPAAEAAVMAVTQRPVTQVALSGPSGDEPRWRSVPSWFLFGELDRNIPAGAHRVMAERAGARRSVEIAGASHVVGISHAAETATIIGEAAESTTYAGT